uniref:Uncharacterized protein n=1 Tax=Acrobeloides nanus TaxID=290746 RepID=A0A914CVK0_9BILA
MITNEQVFRGYYFQNITEAQLKTDMDGQCDKETSGIENTFCKKLIGDDSALLLSDLRANDTALKCCQDGKLCN